MVLVSHVTFPLVIYPPETETFQLRKASFSALAHIPFQPIPRAAVAKFLQFRPRFRSHGAARNWMKKWHLSRVAIWGGQALTSAATLLHPPPPPHNEASRGAIFAIVALIRQMSFCARWLFRWARACSFTLIWLEFRLLCAHLESGCETCRFVCQVLKSAPNIPFRWDLLILPARVTWRLTHAEISWLANPLGVS